MSKHRKDFTRKTENNKNTIGKQYFITTDNYNKGLFRIMENSVIIETGFVFNTVTCEGGLTELQAKENLRQIAINAERQNKTVFYTGEFINITD